MWLRLLLLLLLLRSWGWCAENISRCCGVVVIRSSSSSTKLRKDIERSPEHRHAVRATCCFSCVPQLAD
jgi:hypothetical protein